MVLISIGNPPYDEKNKRPILNIMIFNMQLIGPKIQLIFSGPEVHSCIEIMKLSRSILNTPYVLSTRHAALKVQFLWKSFPKSRLERFSITSQD